MLDEMLQYHETPEDENFVAGVLKGVQRQQRLRRLILAATGVVGAAFGAAGLMMVTDSLNQLITGANVLPVSVALVGLVAFSAWLFQDEVAAVG